MTVLFFVLNTNEDLFDAPVYTPTGTQISIFIAHPASVSIRQHTGNMLAYQQHRGCSILWRMLTYADVCWRILAYADVC